MKEITDLEECARMDGGEVAAPAVSGRFVFVLEESDEELAPARDGRPK